MVIKYNTRFKNLIGEEFSIESYNYPSCNELSELLDEPIVFNGDCYYFNSLVPGHKGFSLTFMDRTGDEAFFNKISFCDYMKREDPIDEFYCGVRFAIDLSKKLDNEFDEKFRVSLSYHDAPDEVRQTCVVRFYKERENERWSVDDLESYKYDSVLEIITKE